MKYAAYYRVSTKKQGDSGLGLEAQRNIVHHYYPNIDREFTEVKSGKNLSERPILQEAIQYCNDTGAILVVAKLDRLSRDVESGIYVLKQLKGNIRFCDMTGNIDRYTIVDKLNDAQRERELISIRTKAAKQVLKSRGVKLGHTPNLHGQKQGAEANRQKALNDENNKRAMSMISIMIGQNLTLEQIANRLNKEKFYTSTGCDWSKGSVSRMLRRMQA